ncbi:MED6, partial [Cordylochernes scorpioides]
SQCLDCESVDDQPMNVTESNPLHLSWHDSAWIPILNPNNVMDYFTERSNPFYDHTCNNETLKMQRQSLDHLTNMTGLEYVLLHVQEPILYIIRKQHRHSTTQVWFPVTPMADYYILAGVVYQAPDLNTVLNSRIGNFTHNLDMAFETALSFARYHPSKGYWWEFQDSSTDANKPAKPAKEEPSSLFQRRRVDILLDNLTSKFPFKLPSPPQLEKQTQGDTSMCYPSLLFHLPALGTFFLN